MATGDGLLVRLRPAEGAFDATQARALARGVRECGNGLFDISTRGNLQIRGVREDTHDDLIARLAETGLIGPEGDPANITITSPLAGLDSTDRIDARRLARAIEVEASRTPGLPPKTAVVIDGGGALALDPTEADMALLGVERVGGPVVALALASPSGPVWIGAVSPDEAPRVVARLLDTYVAILGEAATETRRVRDFAPSHWLRLATAAPARAASGDDPKVARAPRRAGRPRARRGRPARRAPLRAGGG
jgi:precorrin-3B synthase